MTAYASGQVIPQPPSARDPAFDLPAAYAVEAELARLRRADGHVSVGRKVGYANKAVWRMLKLDTLVWAHMYDDTVRYAVDGVATLSLEHPIAPKIEPEIVFKLKRAARLPTWTPPPYSKPWNGSPSASRSSTACLRTGSFNRPISSPPTDCTSRWSSGDRSPVDRNIAGACRAAARFTVRLLKNGQLVSEGSGKNSLRSPALCLAELASAIARQAAAEPLAPGELVSSGTLTESQPIAAGDVWTATVEGLDVMDLTLRL